MNLRKRRPKPKPYVPRTYVGTSIDKDPLTELLNKECEFRKGIMVGSYACSGCINCLVIEENKYVMCNMYKKKHNASQNSKNFAADME